MVRSKRARIVDYTIRYVVLTVAAFVLVLIIGVVALALGGGEGRLLASAIALLIAGPPAAAVSVAVPAGIYRALNQSIEAALVFA